MLQIIEILPKTKVKTSLKSTQSGESLHELFELASRSIFHEMNSSNSCHFDLITCKVSILEIILKHCIYPPPPQHLSHVWTIRIYTLYILCRTKYRGCTALPFFRKTFLIVQAVRGQRNVCTTRGGQGSSHTVLQ